MHEGMPRKQRTTAPDALEHAYRQSVLHDIERRIARYGEHKATPHADRARQFVPFAALKGYEDMAHSRELATAARHELTAEESACSRRPRQAFPKGMPCAWPITAKGRTERQRAPSSTRTKRAARYA